MGIFRGCFYGSLAVGTFVALHFAEPELYAPVRHHPLYEDFVTPVMTELHALTKPWIDEAMKNPYVASMLGLSVADEVADGSTPARPHKVVLEKTPNKDEETSTYGKNFSMPSQMGFSLVQLGEKLKKRSVLSTEGNDSTYFEMPDTSRLWLQRDSVVEVGWSDKEGADSELLLRVEKGMMHIERPGGATGKVYLVTNSGIRYALAPSDAWMATAQMGVADKDSFPDAESKMSGRYMDYVRRATLAEARELSKLLKSDGRREAMLYQDQLRIAADDEDQQRKSLEVAGIMPVEVVAIPLEIPSRRGGKDLAREMIRAPASVALVRPLKFPGRAPASISSLDEGTRIASEAKILRWTDKGQCTEAKNFFEELRKEHGLNDSDSWSLRIKQNFSQRCP
ncbi:MAG: hypothetical protein ABIR96_11445 [Bdellovibrionota bacterium]